MGNDLADSPELPKRVIDVGTLDIEPKLILTSECQRGHYACLSHSWGTGPESETLKTTVDTLRRRTQRIAIKDLPRTFRDAVLTTRALGIRYLWIDSLCILQRIEGQGNEAAEKDWTEEAAKMGDIYRRALVTIFASTSTGAGSGCFNTSPDKNTRLPCLIGEHIITAKCGTHSEHPDIPHDFTLFAHDWASRPVQLTAQTDSFRPRAALDDRGWVLQEEVLSTRAVVFCNDGIYWECLEMVASEKSPAGYPREEISILKASPTSLNTSRDIHWATGLRHAVLGIEDEKVSKYSDRPEMYRHWRKMVENYSMRRLTFEKDRFPALLGITNLLTEACNDVCVQGIWQEDRLEQLLWRTVDVSIQYRSACSCKGRSAIFPAIKKYPRRQCQERKHCQSCKGKQVALWSSWSWASIDQGVTYKGIGTGKPLVEIQKIQANQEKRTNHNAQEIQLRGSLRKLTADGPRENDWDNPGKAQ